MKKLLFLIVPVLVLSSCSEDKAPVPYAVFAADMTYGTEAKSYRLEYYFNTPHVDLIAPDLDWITVVKEDDQYLLITLAENPNLLARSASFTLSSIENVTHTTTIKQDGLAILIEVDKATANSEQSGEGISNTLKDNDDIWHSEYGVKKDFYEATYDLKDGAKELDIIYIQPRSDGGTNGLWGLVEIWVLGTVNGTIDPADSDPMTWGDSPGDVDEEGYILLQKIDFAQSKEPRTLYLPNSVSNPDKVKFKIDSDSSVGSYASLRFIQFFQNPD